MGFKFSSEDFPEDVKVDSLDGLCSIRSRHVQANCQFQCNSVRKVLAHLGKVYMLQHQDCMRLI